MKREFCENCAGLVEGDDGKWICDQVGKKVERVEYCPEMLCDPEPWVPTVALFEIFIQDLSDEAREQLEDLIGKDHNYDVFPLAVIPFQEKECV